MNRFVRLPAFLMAAALILGACSPAESTIQKAPDMVGFQEAGNDIYGMEYQTVAEDNNLILKINRDTTDIVVTNKSSGKEWKTALAYADTVYTGQIFTLSYYDQKGVTNYYNSFDDCISKGAFRMENIPNGIKVLYTIGEIDEKTYAPFSISVERYESFYNKLDDAGKQLLDARYWLVDLSKYEGADRQQVETNYPEAKNGAVYCIRNKKYNGETLREISDVLKSAGYTQKDYAIDSGTVNQEQKNPQVFQLAIYYTLVDGRLVVRVPEKEIFHYKEYPLCTLDVLPWFFSAQMGESGYYLLPDGSGSIMNFFNGKGDLQDYYMPVYGVDKSRYVSENATKLNDAIFPVLGVKNGDNAVLAVIEDGDAFAGITANPGSDTIPPRASTQFRVNEIAKLKSFTGSADSSESFNISQYQRYDGDLKLSFTFLSKENASYTGMAKAYQKQLFQGKTPLQIAGYSATAELVSVIDRMENTLGISHSTQKVLTSFSQAESIALDMKKNGFDRLNIQLSGWLKDGYRNGYTVSPKVQANAGGEKEFLELGRKLKRENIGFYPDADVQYVYANAGKPKNKDVSMFLNKRVGLLYEMDPSVFVLNTGSTPAYILNPLAVSRNISGLKKAMTTWELSSLSLRNVGLDINADYNEKQFVERQSAMKSLKSDVEGLTKSGVSLMGGGGMAPFLPYLRYINNFPLESNGFDNTDYSVPFAGMVASGYVEYTGEALNLSGGEPYSLLRLLESGAGARYVLTGSKDDKMIDSEYNWLYSSSYDEVKNKVNDTWSLLSKAMNGLYGKRIINHEMLAKGVFKTTYENGGYVIVNYNGTAVESGKPGQTVDAYGFIVGKGDV